VQEDERREGIVVKERRNKYRNGNIKENFYYDQAKDCNTLSRKVKEFKFFEAKILLICSQRVKARDCERKTFTFSFLDSGRHRQVRTMTHTFALGGSQRDIMTNFTLFFIKLLFGYNNE
jgi:hypothetical protein